MLSIFSCPPKKSINQSGKQEVWIFHSLVLDTPGPCASVKVKEVSRDSVTITWEVPTIDGGAPVNNYIIEKREAAMRAFKTVTTKCSKTLYRISGLIEGTMLQVLLSHILEDTFCLSPEPSLCATASFLVYCPVNFSYFGLLKLSSQSL